VVTTNTRSRSVRLLAGASALALAALLAACSTPGGSGGGGTGGTALSDADAQALLTEATTQAPNDFQGPTDPVKAPSGVKVAVVTCFSILSGCVSPATGVEQAVKSLGWEARVFDGGGSPDKQNAQMLNAISWGADVILNIAIDSNAVQDGLRAAKDAGVIVGSGSNGTDTPNTVLQPADGKLGYAFDVSPNYAEIGEKAGKWITGDSKGLANVVVYSDKTFPSVLAFQEGLLKGLDACAGCTVQDLQYFTGDQVGQGLPQQIVSYLRQNPDVDYIFIPYDPAAAAIVPAIAQAGFTNVKLVSVLGSQENLGFVRAGKVQVADAAYDNLYMGYAMLDQVARLLTDTPLADPVGEGLPSVVLDSSNAPESGSDWHATFDYVSEFETLWKG
jgi:ABC-type sugar transport system substrate-binding protein